MSVSSFFASGNARFDRALLVCSCLMTAACAEQPASGVSATAVQSRLVESVYLDEWLGLEGGRGRCRVTRAEEKLSEPSDVPAGHVPPDLRVLALHTECEGDRGSGLALESALPEDTLIFLRDPEGGRKAPSVRTKLSKIEVPPLLFELGPRELPLPTRRVFDVETGHAEYEVRDHVSRLSFEAHGERREILLRHRALDASFDRWLEQLVQVLRSEAGAGPLEGEDLTRARKLYRSLVARFEPTRFALTEVDLTEADALQVSLALERPRTHDAPNPVAVFRFTFPGKTALGPAKLLNMEDGQAAIDCADQARDLRLRARKAAPGGSDEDRCNALGLSLRQRCEHLDSTLKADALALQMRCVPGLQAQRGHLKDNPAAHSTEFQITLKRGRRSVGFDHGARYVLSVYGNGSVVFHGKSFVNGTGRSDGRTSSALIQGLFERVSALSWFERRGGEWNNERCSLEDERGDVVTVRLNGRERMVLDRDGCRGPFSREELESFRMQLESAAGITGWTRPSSDEESDPARVSEWTVSAEE